jgi:uncharacterized low-complexity protein
MSNNSRKPVAIAVGAALVGGLALAGSAFSMQPLVQGYALGADQPHHGDHQSEGKCGEGRCGMEKMDTDGDGRISRAEFEAMHEGNAEKFAGIDANGDGFIDAAEMKAHHEAKAAEGKCGEGKCGEGKCGGDRSGDDHEGHADADKADMEGKCGEGKCGGSA